MIFIGYIAHVRLTTHSYSPVNGMIFLDGKWRYAKPNYELDVLRTAISASQLNHSLEQFTISGEKTGEHNMTIVLAWDQTQVNIPVQY